VAQATGLRCPATCRTSSGQQVANFAQTKWAKAKSSSNFWGWTTGVSRFVIEIILTRIRIFVSVNCMNGEEFRKITVWLSFTIVKELVSQCEREYLLPRQIIARGLGQNLGEPVIFRIPEQDKWYLRDYKDFSALQQRKEIWRPLGDQKKVYLSILSQIVKAMPKKFDEVALSLHGTKRAYFGRSRAEIEAPPSKSNEAAKIPDTDRWASVNKSGDKKQKTLSDLMRPLGFSHDYIELISWAPCRKWTVFSSGDCKIV